MRLPCQIDKQRKEIIESPVNEDHKVNISANLSKAAVDDHFGLSAAYKIKIFKKCNQYQRQATTTNLWIELEQTQNGRLITKEVYIHNLLDIALPNRLITDRYYRE